MLLLKNGPVAKVCMSASYQLGNLDWSSIETVVPNDLIVGPILVAGVLLGTDTHANKKKTNSWCDQEYGYLSERAR